MKLRNIAFGALALIIVILAVATVLEKSHGNGFAMAIYGSVWMVALWAITAAAAIAYAVHRRLYRRPVTFMLHLSFIVILTGAAITWTTGNTGTMTLRQGQTAHGYDDNGTLRDIPFGVKLRNFEVLYYEGTDAPRDYVSHVTFTDGDGHAVNADISMNNIATHAGYRFYQSGYDRDGRGTVLSVSHDPWGIGVTYCGYALLLASALLFFLAPGSTFRALLKHPALKGAVAIIAMAWPAMSSAMPRTVPQEVAQDFGRLWVVHNDRVCPVQTLARDFTMKMCKSTSYQGLSAEQVLLGWYCFPESWLGEGMVPTVPLSPKDYEKIELAGMLTRGSLTRMFPHRDRTSGSVKWYCPADSLPVDITGAKADFMHYALPFLRQLAVKGDSTGMRQYIARLALYQYKECLNTLPGKHRLDAELAYNSLSHPLPIAATAVVIGILAFVYYCMLTARSRSPRKAVTWLLNTALAAMWVYVTVIIGLRWYVSRHVPMTNGYETMQMLAWLSLTLTALCKHRFAMALPFGFLLAGLTLMVAMMGQNNPQISHLMPVLQSPLLSVHVAVIMVAYSLLAFAMLNGISAFVLRLSGLDKESIEIQRLAVITRIMLYPAVMLLAVGIFIGAVWANVSWGRYWGWDPKEVWALITLLVYSLALHTASFPRLSRPMAVHWFAVTAFMCVLITYFGVNFLLGGMHSYA